MIEIKNGITISEDELIFKFSRSSGPGGQNVNKVNTRVTLFFDLANSANLSAAQKKRIEKKLTSRISKAGVMRVISQRHRTQKANSRAAVERLRELLSGALETKPVRRKTKIPWAVKQRRLEEKKQRSKLKQQRSGRDFES
ncbi:MAG: alternative ribosome rescue aminoacyl-tRNA hydrolase ArfB [Planctomycetota bacterium]|jgi:ribosome-associated protein